MVLTREAVKAEWPWRLETARRIPVAAVRRSIPSFTTDGQQLFQTRFPSKTTMLCFEVTPYRRGGARHLPGARYRPLPVRLSFFAIRGRHRALSSIRATRRSAEPAGALDSAPPQVKALVDRAIARGYFHWGKQAHRGPIAPGFGASGGGVQVELLLPINVMISLGMMREMP